MRSHGFVFGPTTAGDGSGGSFARGEFRGGNRRLELHYRYSLGLVTYRDNWQSRTRTTCGRSWIGDGAGRSWIFERTIRRLSSPSGGFETTLPRFPRGR